MTVPEQERHDRIEAMLAALRSEGLRNTNQRLEIIREVASTDEHPDVERVYQAVRRRIPNVSLDTVYRTLGTLASLGVIRRVNVSTGSARYDANTSEHHHFVCTSCGLVRDVGHAVVEVGEPGGPVPYGTVEGIEVQLRGVCSACARREARGRPA